ncbi:MAG: PEP-CTERM sorting domain-containing protein [Planctomycetota bacterium]|nr:PEP-CTERM sorting domain-containing protein [Planctomycetota bacterium]
MITLLGVCPVKADIVWTSGHHEVANGDFYDVIRMRNNATLDILGGEIHELYVKDLNIIDMYAGLLGIVVSSPESKVHLWGGNIQTVVAGLDTVHIYGYDFVWTPEDFIPQRGTLTGFWADSTPFSIYLRDCPPSSGNVVLHTIPEPTSLLLLGLGVLFLRKK